MAIISSCFVLIVEVEVDLGQFLVTIYLAAIRLGLSLIQRLVGLCLLLEQSLVQVGQNLIVRQHLDQQQQLVLFLELLKRTVIYLLSYSDLLLQFFHTVDKEILKLVLSIDNPGLEAYQFFVAYLQASILLRQSFLNEPIDLILGGQVVVALLVELASSGLWGQIIA